ncbi:hypothetical protein BWO91_17585 [Plantibacter flavus]|uniref:hypothetical protein n=1 Tax=Plantibacter flavus TaxID=150123 RepID=UPI00099D65CC|nr:hypothetical protein [Plantibacter flavus]AQX81533.1 hypothetical protein BWO91_17585 [Plantibacter flavus]
MMRGSGTVPDDRDTGTPAPTDLASAAVELLRVPLSGFVAERRRLAVAARDDGDDDLATAILALRKPTVAAWALNVLTAHRPDLLSELEQLGSALGDAQRSGDATALRTLGTERRSLIATLVTATVEAAAAEGASLSGAVIETVRQSLQAASADADLAAQVSSGRLTDAPTSSGAGWGGVVGGPAPPAGAPPPTAPSGRRATETATIPAKRTTDADAFGPGWRRPSATRRQRPARVRRRPPSWTSRRSGGRDSCVTARTSRGGSRSSTRTSPTPSASGPDANERLTGRSVRATQHTRTSSVCGARSRTESPS